MPLGNPIRKQNESRMVSVLATEGQTVFTVQGGYIINHISVFRNGVRLSPAEDFTAGDGSTVTLNNAANIDDRIDFHIFDRFTVQNAIVGAASTQTINGDLVLNGKLFGQLDVPSINLTGIITATELDLNGKGDISSDLTIGRNLNIAGVTTVSGTGGLNVTNSVDINGALDVDGHTELDDLNVAGVSTFSDVNTRNITGVAVTFSGALSGTTGTFSGIVQAPQFKLLDNAKAVYGTGADMEIYHNATNSLIQNGTGTLQIITTTGDLFFRGQDNITFNTAGNNERVRIDSSGRMGVNINPLGYGQFVSSGIGTVISANASSGAVSIGFYEGGTGRFYLKSLSGSDGLAFVDADDSSERLRIDSSGRLLIGSTSHQEVYGTSALQIAGTTGATSSMSLVRHGNSPYLTLGSSGGSSLGAVTALSSGDRIGQLTFAGADGTDINTHAASIAAYVDGSVSSNNVPARIVFATGPSEAERVRIDNSGRLLIGTTTEGFATYGDKFTIADSGHCGMTIRSGTSNYGTIYFSDGDDGSAAEVRGFVEYNHSTNALTLGADGSARLRINSSGVTMLGSGAQATPKITGPGGLDVSQYALSICMGGSSGSSGQARADATTKEARLVIPHYTNAEEPMVVAYGYSQNDKNVLNIGGGTGLGNNATEINLHCASDITTTGANNVLKIDPTYITTVAAGIIRTQSSAGSLTLYGGNTNHGGKIVLTGGNGDSDIEFYAESGTGSPREIAKFNQHGFFKARGDMTSYVSDGNNYHELQADNPHNVTLNMKHGSSNGYGMIAQFNHANSGIYAYRVYDYANGNDKAFIRTDGDFESHNSSYGGISDVKLKENIVDAGSQWNDIKALKFRNFNFIADSSNTKMLGLIAQEAETVCPSLVKSIPDVDSENNDLGTETKVLKYSILYMKAVKALQEAQTRIETLEAKVAALEGS